MPDYVYYIIGSGVVLITAALMYLYFVFRLRPKDEKKLKIFFSPVFHKKYFLFSAAIAVLGIAALLYSMLRTETVFLKSLVNAEVFVLLISVSLIDLREKIIPNEMILGGICFWVVVGSIELIFAYTDVKAFLVYSLGGALLCGGVMLIVALIVKTALGMGDVKLITVLGLFYGVMGTYGILFVSMIVMFVVSIFLLIIKKVNKKSFVPMAPFILIGFFANLLAGF